MPRTTGASGKRPRAQRKQSPLGNVAGLAFDMEEPLNDAIGFVRALHLIGFGLATGGSDEASSPVVIVSAAAADRLCALKGTWEGIIAAIQGTRAERKR